MKYSELLAQASEQVNQIMPWDWADYTKANPDALIVDVREPDEFEAVHIKGSIFVPRGILESACEWDYTETIPELVKARNRAVLVICRSGQRSVLAALTLLLLGYEKVTSLKLGLNGLNNEEFVLVNSKGEDIDIDFAEKFFSPPVAPEQRRPSTSS